MKSFSNSRLGGFTLIELLVVVLIIGILSAIALPQYTMSVEKARAAEALQMIRSIADANRRYFMANGEYATDLADLDIEIAGEDSTTGSVKRKNTKFFQYGPVSADSGGDADAIALAVRLPIHRAYTLAIFSSKQGVYCKHYNSEGYRICKAFGASGNADSWGYRLLNL